MSERDILFILIVFIYASIIYLIIDTDSENRKLSKNVEELSKDVARIKKQLKKK